MAANLKGQLQLYKGIRMQSVSSANGQDLSFLQCYICFQNVKKPRMCPSCSKLACQNCLRTWIEESKPECPHCRKPLLLGSFADCERFVNDIKHLLSSMDNNQKLKQKCGDHRIQMSYYCQDCKQAICSDCGMFGRHRSHSIIHLSRVYQENKNKILNELAKFDNKIQLFRKNGFLIKQEMQRLILQLAQKKNFVEEYFVTLIERLDQEYKEKKDKVQAKLDQNAQQIQFLQSFRENICQQLQCKTQKQLITKSEEFISYIKSLCDRQTEFEEEQYAFDTIHQLVPKYQRFTYQLKDYSKQTDAIVYSDPCEVNGIQWRLKIYPRGNGVAKNTHLSVFLQLSKGYENENKYEYKIELINHLSVKDSVVREYSSKFDIGQCWGYNQFLSIADLCNGFLDQDDALHFHVSVRNPSYRSLVRDQQKFIQVLQNKLNCIENPQPQQRREKMNQLAQQVSQRKQQMKNFLVSEPKKEQEEGESEIMGRQSEEEVKVEEHLESDHDQEGLPERFSNIRFNANNFN